jgi:hypothetical protein
MESIMSRRPGRRQSNPARPRHHPVPR